MIKYILIKCKIVLEIEKSDKNIIERFIENSKNKSKLEVEILINETIENICILLVTCIKEKEAEFIVTIIILYN